MSSLTSKCKCNDCGLRGGQIVFGHGPKNPKLMLVGEAPGAQEAQQGRPFVGPAGELIRRILKTIDIEPNDCYFANACLCRPEGNRTPTAGEVNACNERLMAEIEQVQPEHIVTLGATPARAMFAGFRGLKVSRGKLQTTKSGHTGVITYHPAACFYRGGDTLLPFIVRDIEKVKRLSVLEERPYSSQETRRCVLITRSEIRDYRDYVLSSLSPDVLSFDWETTGVNPRQDDGFCLGMTVDIGHGAVVPITNIIGNEDLLSDIFNHCQVIGFNTVFDALFNRYNGLPDKIDGDVMLMHAQLDERPQERNLENLSMEYCDAPSYESNMLAEYKCSKAEMTKVVPSEVIYRYCAIDVDFTLRLYHIFREQLEQLPRQKKLYNKMIVQAARAFRDITDTGVWVDQKKLQETDERYRESIEQQVDNMRRAIGKDEFNPNSHPQVHSVLWDYLQFTEPVIYKRKPRSACVATRKKLLENYPGHEFLEALDKYKSDYTTWSRYIRGLPQHIEPDGRVRCSWHFDRTETGRLSTTRPALHQIPRDSGIRTIFSAPPGRVLVQADYEQIEMRMVAHIARDPKLTQLLVQLEKEGTDFHTKMASEAFRIPLNEVMPEQRQSAKAVSFGLLYLMGEKKLAAGTGLPGREAIAFVKQYKDLMPAVWEWVADIRRQVRENGYVESIFGRRRRFYLITPENIDDLHREAVNMPVQSSASDLTLWKVIELHEAFLAEKIDAKIIIMVHDSIVTETNYQQVGYVAQMKKEIMTKAPFKTDVPFPVEIKTGQCWGEGERIV